MNGIPPALRAVGDGTLSLTVELNPVNWGRLGVDVLAGYLKGQKYRQQVFITHVLIDAKNIGAKMPKN
jgi:ribose transport system substrate-binding protein